MLWFYVMLMDRIPCITLKYVKISTQRGILDIFPSQQQQGKHVCHFSPEETIFLSYFHSAKVKQRPQFNDVQNLQAEKYFSEDG